MRTPRRPRPFGFVLAMLALVAPPAARAQVVGMGGGMGGVVQVEVTQDAPLPRHPPHPIPAAVARTWLMLQKTVRFDFKDETPLEDLLKHIREVTREKGPEGKDVSLPIYVDPRGLQQAEKTFSSPVQLELEDVSVASALELLLKQADLKFEVRKDGIVVITNEANEGRSEFTPPITAEAARTWLALHRPAARLEIKDAPLSEAIDLIAKATAGKEGHPGVPIYVDPAALAEADRTLESKVTLALDGAPIATALALITGQVGLAYRVQEDGIVVVRARSEEDDAPPTGPRPETIAVLRARLEEARLLALIARYKATIENPTPIGMGEMGGMRGMGGGMGPQGGPGMMSAPTR